MTEIPKEQTNAALTFTNTCKHTQSVSSSCLIKHTIVPFALSQCLYWARALHQLKVWNRDSDV